MKKLIYLFLLIPFLCQCTGKEGSIRDNKESTIFEIYLKGMEYNDVTLVPYNTTPPYMVNKRNENSDIKGQSSDKYKWTFTIPSSTQTIFSKYCLIATPKEESNNKHLITFSTKELSHRMIMWSVPFEDNNNSFVKCSYFNTLKDSIRDYQYSAYNLSKNDDNVTDSIIKDLFYLEIDKKDIYAEWELGFAYPKYGLMPEDDAKYAETMEEYIELAKKYPESLSLLSRIGPRMGFRSKEDIERVYNVFSKETRKKHEDSYPYTKEYLDHPTMHTDIKTLKLKNYETGAFEPVVKDKSKATLVLFSSIGWNRNPNNTITIAALKDIYKEKVPSLDIVLINVDYDNIEEWKELIIKEQTPWRNLHVDKKERFEISDTYKYWGVDSGILIDTEGNIKILHVYNINKLEEIIKNH